VTSPRLGTEPPPVAVGRAELAGLLEQVRGRGDRIHLVPTMGALHEGHAALIRAAAAGSEAGDAVVVSIFVNPTQFAPGEDFDAYPRTLDADLALCRGAGATMVFCPTVEEMYPQGEPQVTVDPGPVGARLEGWSRPTHFRGVLTVVAKLFGLVRPDRAYFGEKDYQQLILIRQMVTDLALDVDIVGLPTVRATDGLAMSSRNRYLDDDERAAAVRLSEALRAGVEAASGGAAAAEAAALSVLAGRPDVEIDYLVVTDPVLGPPPVQGEGRILVAARVGPARLIDNMRLVLGPERE